MSFPLDSGPPHKLAVPFVPAEVIRETWSEADDAMVDFLLWEFTGWPSFWNTDRPDEEIRVSMRRLRRAWKVRCLLRTLLVRNKGEPWTS